MTPPALRHLRVQTGFARWTNHFANYRKPTSSVLLRSSTSRKHEHGLIPSIGLFLSRLWIIETQELWDKSPVVPFILHQYYYRNINKSKKTERRISMFRFYINFTRGGYYNESVVCENSEKNGYRSFYGFGFGYTQ